MRGESCNKAEFTYLGDGTLLGRTCRKEDEDGAASFNVL